MDAKKLITFGAVGLAGWWLYSNWGSLMGGAAAAPAPAPGALPPVAAPPAAAPAPAAVTAPNYAGMMDMPTLIAKLKAAAGAVSTLNQDQWNYYRNTIAPPALTGEQFGTAFPNGPQVLTADDFVATLHAVGLAAYRRPRTMVRAHRINYRVVRRAA